MVGLGLRGYFRTERFCGRGRGEYNHANYSSRADDNRGVIEVRICRRYLLLLFDSCCDPILRF